MGRVAQITRLLFKNRTTKATEGSIDRLHHFFKYTIDSLLDETDPHFQQIPFQCSFNGICSDVLRPPSHPHYPPTQRYCHPPIPPAHPWSHLLPCLSAQSFFPPSCSTARPLTRPPKHSFTHPPPTPPPTQSLAPPTHCTTDHAEIPEPPPGRIDPHLASAGTGARRGGGGRETASFILQLTQEEEEDQARRHRATWTCVYTQYVPVSCCCA